MKRTTLAAVGGALALLLTACDAGTTPTALPVEATTAGADLAAGPVVPARAANPAAPIPAAEPAPAPAPTARRPAADPVADGDTRPENALGWGRPALGTEDLAGAVRAAWADSHRVPADQVRGDELMSGLTGDGALMVGAYQLWAPGGPAHVVVASGPVRGESSLHTDLPADPSAGAVAAVVAGSVVVAVAPGTTRVEYRADAESAWAVVEQDSRDLVLARSPSPGAGEALRVTGEWGSDVLPLGATAAADRRAPANVLLWEGRGTASEGPAPSTVAAAFADATGVQRAWVRRLFSGRTDDGVRYLVGQAWGPTGPAQTVSYVLRPGGEAELQIQPVTPAGTRVVVAQLADLPGSSDLLVVLSEPGTGGTSYRGSSTAPWAAVGGRDAAVVMDRARDVQGDALRLWTDGADPLVVTVADALCQGCG